ncbi:MAG: MoxR family ATPase [Oscillospiraceae bacterium]|nr:MoxR family ATPase [Oscillospiraceae bacterium]
MNKAEMLIENIEKVIVGKHETIFAVTAALLAGGHVLIEDVPGVGKTQLASAMAKSVNGIFNRIQLTPDIMPSDVVGFTMINSATHETEYRKGAAFCNFLLADEINRASPKAQSALLEAMEERQISIDGNTHALPVPFMVMATQNPVETYGTYHLPEAQMDRFIMKVSMGYPTADEELLVLSRTENTNPVKEISDVISIDDVKDMQEEVKAVRCTDSVKAYIIALCNETRDSDCIRLGASPRGSIALFKAAKAAAYINGRDYVLPEDVKELAVSVLSHRLMLSPKGKAEFGTAENIVQAILGKVPVPEGPDAKGNNGGK